MSIKNYNDTIGNRARDLPACSAVHQPTAPTYAPSLLKSELKVIQDVPVHVMKALRGRSDTAPHILSLEARWR
jgi:hypothetical protein